MGHTLSQYLKGRFISTQNESIFITARMFLHVSVCPRGGDLQAHTLGGSPGPGPGGIPACTEADTPLRRLLLLRAVRILLECILVHNLFTNVFQYEQFFMNPPIKKVFPSIFISQWHAISYTPKSVDVNTGREGSAYIHFSYFPTLLICVELMGIFNDLFFTIM